MMNRKSLMLGAALSALMIGAGAPARVAAMTPEPHKEPLSKNFSHAREMRTPKAIKKAAKKARQKAWLG